MGDPASYNFTWKITNFSELTAKKLYSEVFTDGRFKWNLLIFPKGNNVDSLSIYLKVADSSSLPIGWNRYASFSLALINQFNVSTIRKDTEHLFTAKESDWGFTSFIPLSKLKDHASRYLPNDTLTVEAQVQVRSVVTESQNQTTIDDSKQPSAPAASSEEKSLPEDRPSEPRQSSPDVHVKSKNILTEIASRTRTYPSNEILASMPDNVHQQKEALQGFFNMSLEAIQQANAFGNIEGIILALSQQADSLQEKTILEDLASRLSDFRESAQNSTTMVETAQARRASLAGKTMDVNARLEQRQMEISSLESKFSKISEEETELQAEIQRLITQKEELLSQKNSVTIELEKANQEASKDLEEWRSLEGEIKLANAEWLTAKEKLAFANVRWKLYQEDLCLGKL